MQPSIQCFYHQPTCSFTYLINDPDSGHAAIIDPVLDFDPVSMRIDSKSIEQVLEIINKKQLKLKWVLETHVHADHLTAAPWLKQETGASVVAAVGVTKVQDTFNAIYGFTGNDAASPDDFDRLLKDGEKLPLGNFEIEVIHTPGHTPSCCTYVIGENAFVGDTLFMPDFGTARCDFPSGDPRQLFQSIQKILALPGNTQLYMCHDYMPGGRELKWQTSVTEQKQSNIHIHDGVTEAAYVEMRTNRDAQLSVPKLILPALQVNIRAGQIAKEESTGLQYLKFPINQF